MILRFCRRCEEHKPEDAFRRGHICRDCERAASRANTFRYTRGITHEERDELLHAQGGACASCGSTDPRSKLGWHVDHNHMTGLIRGVLCSACNVTLGMVKDSISHLQKLINYLSAEGATTIPQGSRAKWLEAHGPSTRG